MSMGNYLSMSDNLDDVQYAGEKWSIFKIHGDRDILTSDTRIHWFKYHLL